MQLLWRIQFHHTYLALPLHSVWGDPCDHLWCGYFERHTHRPLLDTMKFCWLGGCKRKSAPCWAKWALVKANTWVPCGNLLQVPMDPIIGNPWVAHVSVLHWPLMGLIGFCYMCGTNMDISRGQNVGPTHQLAASPHGSQQWQPMCGPWECLALAIHGTHGILLSGKFVKKMTITLTWIWIREIICPVD